MPNCMPGPNWYFLLSANVLNRFHDSAYSTIFGPIFVRRTIEHFKKRPVLSTGQTWFLIKRQVRTKRLAGISTRKVVRGKNIHLCKTTSLHSESWKSPKWAIHKWTATAPNKEGAGIFSTGPYNYSQNYVRHETRIIL